MPLELLGLTYLVGKKIEAKLLFHGPPPKVAGLMIRAYENENPLVSRKIRPAVKPGYFWGGVYVRGNQAWLLFHGPFHGWVSESLILRDVGFTSMVRGIHGYSIWRVVEGGFLPDIQQLTSDSEGWGVIVVLASPHSFSKDKHDATLRSQLCRKEGISPTIRGWDWDHQSWGVWSLGAKYHKCIEMHIKNNKMIQ